MVLHYFDEKGYVGLDALYVELLERAGHPLYGNLPRLGVNYEFGYERVVVTRHGVIAVYGGIHPDARASRHVEFRNLSRGRDEGQRVFRVDPALYGMAFKGYVFLRYGEFLSRGYLYLLLHYVHADD